VDFSNEWLAVGCEGSWIQQAQSLGLSQGGGFSPSGQAWFKCSLVVQQVVRVTDVDLFWQHGLKATCESSLATSKMDWNVQQGQDAACSVEWLMKNSSSNRLNSLFC
jgi:hypothetical protein